MAEFEYLTPSLIKSDPPFITKLNQVTKCISGHELWKEKKGGEFPSTSGLHRACIICQEDLTREMTYRRLTCEHTFHKPCLDKWMAQWNASCPLCSAKYYHIGGPCQAMRPPDPYETWEVPTMRDRDGATPHCNP
ncbi:hypothetical protein FQN55_001031, partial [Onygenales sp. PD_40]